MDAPHNGRPFGPDGAASNGAAPQQAGSTVVMGAGPGGLCSAYVLSKAGVPTTVLEKAPFVGGLARTIRRQTEYGEFRFDIGGHRWFTKNDELNELFREVVAEELLWVNRISRIYFDGKYVDYPLKISNALKAIGPVVAAKAMADYGRTRVQAAHQPVAGRVDGGRLHRSVRSDALPALFPALLGEGVGSALRPDERRLGLAALERHVAGDRRQGRGCSVEGQGRQPDRRVHVPARWVRPLFGADGRRDQRGGKRDSAQHRGREGPSRREPGRRRHGLDGERHRSASKRTTTSPRFR